MLSKESKIRVLENFYALDYMFFGRPSNKVKNCCPALLDEYVTVKGALLSVMVEMLELVNHKPASIAEVVTTESMKTMAKSSAKIARENCKVLVSSKKGQAEVKNLVSEVLKQNNGKKINVESVVKQTIREKAFKLAIDNLLIARVLTESEDYKRLNEWEGKLLEEAYKVLRDDLAETALMVVDSTK